MKRRNILQIVLMDLCNWMLISCQAADGNNDYTVIDLIWGLPEQTCFCNDRYFSRTLKLDAGYPLSSSVITCRSVGFPCMVWFAWVVIAPLLADVPDNAYEYSFFLRFYLLNYTSLYFYSSKHDNIPIIFFLFEDANVLQPLNSCWNKNDENRVTIYNHNLWIL